METDNQLLESYAKTESEHSFRELVERRINLVHSAALRESGGDVPFAEDITQAVFSACCLCLVPYELGSMRELPRLGVRTCHAFLLETPIGTPPDPSI